MDPEELRRRRQAGPYFEVTVDNHLDIYDKLPYVRDINICNAEYIRPVSGNIIKHYQYDPSHINEKPKH